MNDLIKINDTSDRPTVSGRELHEFLEVGTPYDKWFPRMTEYGFTEGEDFSTFLSESTGGRPATDHQLTIDMAKEIAMIQRTEKGKLARQYFLDIERRWNSPEATMARALQFSQRTLEAARTETKELRLAIEAQRPKVIFADAVSVSKSSILIGDLAKLIKQNGHDMGQKRLFDWLRANDYLIKGGASKNMPTQRSMDLALFEVKESTISNPDGSVRITKTTKVTGKGQIYFVNKFCGLQKGA